MPRHTLSPHRPTVYVAESEYERLSNLSECGATRGAAILAEELARAIVVADDGRHRPFVRLYAFVEFKDALTGRSHRVQIVPPDEADFDQDRLSVLSPVGASLLGLRAGDAIGMRPEDGRAHVLEIHAVERAREAA